MPVRPCAILVALLCLATLPLSTFAEEEAPAETSPAAAAEAQPETKPAAEADADDEKPSEEELLAGHSAHGEAFNEGPRQAAYLMQGTGDVSFPCTTKSEQAQAFINQGVGQLHGFWYYEAERSFRQAASLDPDCAIAYWGMARANVNNEDRAKGFIQEAMERKEKASRREQLYIEAQNAFITADTKKKDGEKNRRQALVKALEDIIDQFPDDVEAKALLGLQIWDNRSKGIPISSYYAVDALLNDVLEANPLHPVHHYRIHLWDYERPENALNSAADCGPSAPAIAHMWHMPGHIYSRLKRYPDAVWQQEASARVDHAHMARDRVMPDQIHNFAHNNEWLIRNLVFIGRAGDALDLAKNMIDLPRHPKFNTLTKKGSAHFGRLRLFQTLQEFELWDEALALADTRYLEPTDREEEQLKRTKLLVEACFRSGRVEQGDQLLEELRQQKTQLEAERDESVANVARVFQEVNKPKEEIEAAQKKDREKFDKQIKPLQKALDDLAGYEHLAHERWGEAAEALKKSRAAASAIAWAQLKAGKTDDAVETIGKEVSRRKHETLPLANQAHLLWEAGRQEEAKKAMESLHEVSSEIDLQAPPFARLAPIVSALEWPDDWRQPRSAADDLGNRPPLDELGPFRWQPSPAPSWTLADSFNAPWSLQKFKGKPVVVIFYLGFGCLHCVEQLQAFEPLAEDFREAGIELIAISTDDMQMLTQSRENYEQGEFQFPLVSNAGLDVFKAYRCYDDFEKTPLHGTFLIDAEGMVRWQDIGYEPFMDAKFLLAESQRLLKQETGASEGAGQGEAPRETAGGDGKGAGN